MFQKNQAKILIFAPYIGSESRVFWYGPLSLFGADFSKACLRKDDLWELAGILIAAMETRNHLGILGVMSFTEMNA